ncbi:hypothetical protein [Virgibacillus siamensis]|uniref:hypothetical protein n=1 Tax=Virgibacillus siamensis TaxID=480071 RepID=UPI000987641A|nr:hypothetical protein [Virgibacillus siamensis]
MYDVEQTATTIRDAIRDIPKTYEYNEKDIKRLDQETQDLLHLAELTNFNAFEGYSIAKEIQSVRQARRQLKDENEMLVELHSIMKELQPYLKDLNKSLGNIRQIKKKHAVRTYRCRERKDLQGRISG